MRQIWSEISPQYETLRMKRHWKTTKKITQYNPCTNLITTEHVVRAWQRNHVVTSCYTAGPWHEAVYSCNPRSCFLLSLTDDQQCPLSNTHVTVPHKVFYFCYVWTNTETYIQHLKTKWKYFFQHRFKTWYCRDRVSSCNIYAVQQDTQTVLMSEFIQHFLLAWNISDLIGPSSGAFCTSCMCRLWYVVIRVLLDTSSRYKVLPTTL